MYAIIQQSAAADDFRTPWPIVFGAIPNSEVELVHGRPDAHALIGFNPTNAPGYDSNMIPASAVVAGDRPLSDIVGRFPVFTSETGMFSDSRPIRSADPYDVDDAALSTLRQANAQMRTILLPEKLYTVIGQIGMGSVIDVLAVIPGEQDVTLQGPEGLEYPAWSAVVRATSVQAAKDRAEQLVDDADHAESKTLDHGDEFVRINAF